MPNPIPEPEQPAGFVPRLQHQIFGIAADFWKDTPCQFPTLEFKVAGRVVRIPNLLKPMPVEGGAAAPSAPAAPAGAASAAAAPRASWHALPG